MSFLGLAVTLAVAFSMVFSHNLSTSWHGTLIIFHQAPCNWNMRLFGWMSLFQGSVSFGCDVSSLSAC